MGAHDCKAIPLSFVVAEAEGWRVGTRGIGSLVENEKGIFILSSLPIPEP